MTYSPSYQTITTGGQKQIVSTNRDTSSNFMYFWGEESRCQQRIFDVPSPAKVGDGTSKIEESHLSLSAKRLQRGCFDTDKAHHRGLYLEVSGVAASGLHERQGSIFATEHLKSTIAAIDSMQIA